METPEEGEPEGHGFQIDQGAFEISLTTEKSGTNVVSAITYGFLKEPEDVDIVKGLGTDGKSTSEELTDGDRSSHPGRL